MENTPCTEILGPNLRGKVGHKPRENAGRGSRLEAVSRLSGIVILVREIPSGEPHREASVDKAMHKNESRRKMTKKVPLLIVA